MQIERTFAGIAKIEDILSSILSNRFDSLTDSLYHDDRANVIPSDMEGVAEQ